MIVVGISVVELECMVSARFRILNNPHKNVNKGESITLSCMPQLFRSAKHNLNAITEIKCTGIPATHITNLVQ